MAAVAVSDEKARVKDNLAKVQDALMIVEEARSKAKAEAEVAPLEVE